MSLTSYRTAPPRGTVCDVPRDAKRAALAGQPSDFVNGSYPNSLAAMPGDDLLFQRLSVSTIGAVRFHGRVRDGIGWVTDAMATKQWSQRIGFLIDAVVVFDERLAGQSSHNNRQACR